MPSSCLRCGSKDGPSVAIPYAAKRSKYCGVKATQLTVEEVKRWRQKFILSCGVSQEAASTYVDSPRLVVCLKHLPSTAHKNGVLQFDRKKDVTNFICMSTQEEQNSIPQESNVDKALNVIWDAIALAAAKNSNLGFTSAGVKQLKRNWDQLKTESKQNRDKEEAEQPTKQQIKKLKKKIKIQNEKLEEFRKATPFLRFEKFEESVSDHTIYTLTGIKNAKCLKLLFQLVQAYANKVGCDADRLNIYRGPNTKQPKDLSKGRRPELSGLEQMFFTLFVINRYTPGSRRS